MNGFLGNLNFARVGGASLTLVGVSSPAKGDGDDGVSVNNTAESGGASPQKLLGLPPEDVSDKQKSFFVQDFFRYTKTTGANFLLFPPPIHDAFPCKSGPSSIQLCTGSIYNPGVASMLSADNPPMFHLHVSFQGAYWWIGMV
ncbi:hypothetical protein Ancab_023494 [Ancistrocladus abbreviatus]